MKKIFCTLMIFALMILPNICGAKAAFHPETVKGEYHIVFPEFDPIDDSQIPIYAKITTTFNNLMDGYWRSVHFNDSFISSTMNYEIMCDTDEILSMVFTMTIHVDNGIYEKDAQGNDIPAIYKQTLNFDMRTGDEIEPDNLKIISDKYNFTPKDISQKLKSYAKAHNLKLSPNFEDLQSIPYCYYVDENLHLHFIFNGSTFSPSLKYYDFVDIDVTI